MSEQEITIVGKQYRLTGTLISPTTKLKNKLSAVIFFHGMVSQRKPRYVKRAQSLAKRGIAALTFDFRGCGESDGKLGELSLANWLDDALLAFDYLSQLPFINKERIGISGKSFGGYMAALVCSKRKVKSMVLQAPAVYNDSWFSKKYQYYSDEHKEERLKYRNSAKALNNKAIRAIRKYKSPLLIVGSELDDICPKEVVEGYFKLSAAKNKKIIWIKEADHPLTKEVWNKEYTQFMTKWFVDTL